MMCHNRSGIRTHFLRFSLSSCHSQGHNIRSLPHAQCNSGQLMQCTPISRNKPTNATIRQTMQLKYKLWHYIQAEKPFVNVHRLSCSNTTAHGTTNCISKVAVCQLHCKNCTATIALYVAPDVALREALKAKKSQNCGLCPYLP